ncbi:MAG: site-specific DNA-methyltransferase [Candidatus Hydrogenedentota bacterium]
MDTIEKFQDLVKGLFQFETSDLDFGIYRILNYKRDQIRKFIEEDLVHKVESAFAKHKDERLINISQKFKEAKEKIIQSLGTEAFTPTDELKEQFKDTPLGRDYLSLKAQKDEAETIDEIKLQVFNDLYSFFSRFYEEGDFFPQYRYSIKGHKYAIPYNGEEVKLYWANSEQYYTKTGLLFRDYTFKANDYKIIFRIVSAKEELGSKKATKERFFIFDDENPVEEIPSPLVGDGKCEGDNKTLIIHFQYRELSEREVKSYQVEGGSNTSKQEKINQRSYEEVLKDVKDIELKARLGKEYKNEKPLLLYQLNRFTTKNTKDYFIHKNLKKFLSEQLDYFIKAEVLSIETLGKERFLDKHITRAKIVREIGEDIIDFLSQIEDFQKRLWEKKKFVLKTEYVITTDRVPEEFHDEIWNNKEQNKEWKELGFEASKTKEELKKKKLPIDTRYFSQEFKERLLEKLTENADLDELLDGLLIKSENYQALNLLLGKYKEKVQTIYIDPPFNKEQDADYLYNVKYKDSTWVSCLENRLWLAKSLLNDRGSIFVRCDYNGNMFVRLLMNEIFGEENFRNEIMVGKTKTAFYLYAPPARPQNFSQIYDNLFWYSKYPFSIFENLKKGITPEKRESYWKDFKTFYDRTENRYELLGVVPEEGCSWMWKKEESLKAIRNYEIYAEEFESIGKTLEEFWIKTEMKLNFLKKEGNTIKYWVPPIKNISHNNWTDLEGYARQWNFPTENSEILLKRVIESTSNEGNVVMDFFLGSGTTIAVAHKLKRKWLGVEMGEHFWTVVLPRMKKVLAYDKSGISKEKDVKEKYNEKTAGGFFKYQILEQYEDTLDNIELTPNKQAELKFGDDYLLKYFIDYETRENPYLLNIEHLKKPFSYKLKVNLEEVGEPQEIVVDIPETFNYLLGLKVKKVKVRDNGRKYLFILGEKEGKNIAIVWREHEDKWTENDFKKDKEFIIEELEPWRPHIVYVNGQSILTPKLREHPVEIRYIEGEFKRLMG